MREKNSIKSAVKPPPRLTQRRILLHSNKLQSNSLSRKGLVAGLFKLLGQADAAERPALGQLLNDLKTELETLEATRKQALTPKSKGPPSRHHASWQQRNGSAAIIR